MNSEFTHEMKVSFSLNEKEIREVIDFKKKLKYPSHFNNPYWAEWVEPYKKPLFFRFYNNTALSGFGIGYTRMSFCILHFGPMVLQKENIYEYVLQIALYLKKEKFGLLTVQLHPDIEIDKSLFLKNTILQKKITFQETGWYTIKLDVTGKSPEEVLKNFSKGHKSSIKKAYKEGLETKFINDKNVLEKLSKIYDDMHHRKGLILPLPDSKAAFKNIFDNKLGKFIGVFKGNELIGGLLFISERNNLLYKFGATDVRYHNVPVLHVAIYEMIKHAIETNHKKVDLGGYDPVAKPHSYSYGINLFKKGFGGEIVTYSYPFTIRLNFMKTFLINFAIRVNKLIPEKIKKILYVLLIQGYDSIL